MPNLLTPPAPATGVAPPATPVKVTTALVWVTTAAIFCQAIIAGQFVSQDGKDGWITVHGVVADASWVLSLITVGYAFFTLRRHFPVLVRLAAVLFAVTLLQTGIGHLITEAGVDWLIAVHVPLAFVVFAVAGYLSVWAVRVRHQLNTGHLDRAAEVGAMPNADVHDVVRPTTEASGSRAADANEHSEQGRG
ncbi:MAG: hypothetical protein QOF53_1839 [Nocardioidaceae bacterium]|jgi:hypothetical protein|nr:hypothetical protein [Nocardioidaceae bacterium]